MSLSGIVNIFKPAGISSSQAVGKVRRALGERRVGHMGTLDPMGSGVLLMGVGKCTRLFDHFLGKSKTYEASFRFGIATDTLDITGRMTDHTDKIPTMSDINDKLSSFIGRQMQMPPQYSAKSVGGVRAYDLARSGKIADLTESEIEIYDLALLRQTGENEYMFSIDCSSGTYIRSLCRDLAESLGSLATMTSITRTRCGDFLIKDSVPPDEVTEENIVPPSVALSALPSYVADEGQYKKLVNGVPVAACDAPDGKFALYCRGELLGIAECGVRGIRIVTYLKEDLSE